jgi:exodeoxyribonuclease V beta subunit
MTGSVEPFDVCGPLPTGVTVLEASAGTGKTSTIAALAARYVADGLPLENLLLVTFTRMATGELRDRVRERLVTAEHGLARALAGVQPAEDDVLRLLADGPPSVVVERRGNLAKALADFDAATISTTHGFCKHVLSGLGIAGDVERDVTFLEDPRDILEEVVDDLYVRRFHSGPRRPPMTRAEALRIAQAVVDNPEAAIDPRHAPDERVAMRVRLASAVRKELEHRKLRAGLLTYDDLLTRLQATLDDERRRAAACERLRRRYRVALVDEFQDTDPTQWGILRRIFGEAHATLVLIGDPKQAIYAFRGADVHAYLAAAKQAGGRATLATNWRSDQGLIDAYDALFRGVKLGHPGIGYQPVRAAEAHGTGRLIGAPVEAALRVRIVHRDDGIVRLTPKGFTSAQPAREHIAVDLAADLVALLSSGARLLTRRRDGSEKGLERVRPGHAAVLVRRHRDAALVRDALEAVGIPAVINGAGSVFATPAALEWLLLLEALERPTSPTRGRAAALTAFFGWSAERVATAPDEEWERVHARLHHWADVLEAHGVAALQEAVSASERIPGRVLARPDGERVLTDLRHVGELLHAAASGEQLGPTALAAWLRQRIAEAPQDIDAEDRSRRLESDAEAVQVLTIHRSKGLEFPIVYCPYLWEPGWIPEGTPPVFHDPDRGDRRTIDLSGQAGPRRRRFIEEQRGEDLRLAYVALTRARHQAVVWWAASWDSRNSPLGRLLFCREQDGTVAAVGEAPAEDDEVVARFTELATRVPGCISVERTAGATGGAWEDGAHAAADLDVACFDRDLDRHWRRTSYTAITAGSHEPRVGSEPDEDLVSDEAMPAAPAPVGDEAAASLEARLRAQPSLLADLPGGTAVGTLVHAVLESTDFSACDLGAELAARVDEQRGRRLLVLADAGTLVTGLRAAIETPLGPLLEDARLRDFGRPERVDELAFELPLVGGDRPTADLGLEEVGRLLRAHLPPDDVLAEYPQRLADHGPRGNLRGFLAGSIDLVLRLRGADGTARFAVVDYKTNWLGVEGQALSAWHYRPAALAQAMQRAHYPLQAMLYLVALHRYLRWRLAGYDPARHLAGVAYLFLRGMTGSGVPRIGGQPCGVFTWRPPPALVGALSDLLDRGAAPA